MPSLYDELLARGYIKQTSDIDVETILEREKVTVYAGFDPTADSLQCGNLVPIMALSHFQRKGHRVIVLVGGATGMVGDPSGKSDERKLLTPEDVARNAEGIKKQLMRFLNFKGDNPAIILDNNSWIGSMTFIDWLREVGKYFTVNYMLAKDSVKERLSSEGGISFTEFSYMTMQAYDFLYLFDKHGCRFQCGGSEQWGNITAGIDLIRKTRGKKAYGITFNLVTTANGEKFGKSAGNAIWLDQSKTSPYEFYQYWMRTDDRQVDSYLRLFTYESIAAINDLSRAHSLNPEKREAQRKLAAEVTRLVHGDEETHKAENASNSLYGEGIPRMNDSELGEAYEGVPTHVLPRATLDGSMDIVELLASSGIMKSKGASRRLIEGGGIYLNKIAIEDSKRKIVESDLVSESCMVLRVGKKDYHKIVFK